MRKQKENRALLRPAFKFVKIEKAKLVGFFRVNGDLLALCIEAFKLHLTVNKGEQGKVPAHTDIVAFVEVRAALTNDDVASLDDFACVLLNTKVLGVTVAAVTY